MSDTCVQEPQTEQQQQQQQRHHHEEACAEKCKLEMLPFEGGTVADVRHLPLESLAAAKKEAASAAGSRAAVKPHPTACRLVPVPKGNGHQLTVRGVVNPRAERFELNLLTGTIHPHAITHAMVDTQIPLHAVFHFGGDVHQVVLNSYLAGDWDREEAEHHPFQRGALFEVRVKHFEDRYELQANGKHLAGYTYRICPKAVNYVQVCGDVELDEVSWGGGGDGEKEDPAEKSFTTVHAGTCPFCRTAEPPAADADDE